MADKPLLNIGLRLGLLKKSWGFPINQDLADAISGGGRDETRDRGRLDYSTVHRRATKGTAPREFSDSQIAEGLASFLDSEGRLRALGTSKASLVGALTTADDIRFANYVADSSQKQLPVPQSVREANGARLAAERDRIVGKFVMYRLGIEVKRRGRLVVMDSSARNVLRCVPVKIADGDSYFDYQEDYFGNRSSGFVLLIDQYLTVWGEDADRVGYSELFLAHIMTEPNESGLLEGVITMDGDLGNPTAYRTLLRRAPDEDQELDWPEFVKKYEKTIVLTDLDNDNVFETAETEEETDTPYQAYVDQLQIKMMRTDLWH